MFLWSRCSRFETPIARLSIAKPTRVCEACFNIIKANQASEDMVAKVAYLWRHTHELTYLLSSITIACHRDFVLLYHFDVFSVQYNRILYNFFSYLKFNRGALRLLNRYSCLLSGISALFRVEHLVWERILFSNRDFPNDQNSLWTDDTALICFDISSHWAFKFGFGRKFVQLDMYMNTRPIKALLFRSLKNQAKQCHVALRID